MTRTKPTKDDILALEKSYWDAMKAKDGKRTAQLSGRGLHRQRLSRRDAHSEGEDGRDDGDGATGRSTL